MIDPARLLFYVPRDISSDKRRLFDRIGQGIVKRGGRMLWGDPKRLDEFPELMPVIGCTAELAPYIRRWTAAGRDWIYWDNGYVRRGGMTSFPADPGGIHYRWHVNSFQMRSIREVPADRWSRLYLPVEPWRRGGRNVIVAAPSAGYEVFHGIPSWTRETVDRLKQVTDRPILIRRKDIGRRRLAEDLQDAHCLVTHGSIAAVEAVFMGCPVIVHPESAAALVGKTSLCDIEQLAFPERQSWLHSLAYSQFSEREIADGKIWGLVF